MKREYEPPRLVEYGRIDQLTQGSGNNAPDSYPNGISANSNCLDPTAIGCTVRFPKS
jgi:hypothetical protein